LFFHSVLLAPIEKTWRPTNSLKQMPMKVWENTFWDPGCCVLVTLGGGVTGRDGSIKPATPQQDDETTPHTSRKHQPNWNPPGQLPTYKPTHELKNRTPTMKNKQWILTVIIGEIRSD
jgi:hypothetical protein